MHIFINHSALHTLFHQLYKGPIKAFDTQSQYRIPCFCLSQFWLPGFGLSQCKGLRHALSQYRKPRVCWEANALRNQLSHHSYNTENYAFATFIYYTQLSISIQISRQSCSHLSGGFQVLFNSVIHIFKYLFFLQLFIHESYISSINIFFRP